VRVAVLVGCSVPYESEGLAGAIWKSIRKEGII